MSTATENIAQPHSPHHHSGVETQLQEINKNLSNIHNSIEAANPRQEPPKAASRWTITLATGFIGMRLFGKIGASIGFAYNAMKTVNKYLLTKKLDLTEFIVGSTIWSSIGAALAASFGGIFMGVLGYNKADNIKNIDSFTKNPLSAFATLFGKPEEEQAEKPLKKSEPKTEENEKPTKSFTANVTHHNNMSDMVKASQNNKELAPSP